MEANKKLMIGLGICLIIAIAGFFLFVNLEDDNKEKIILREKGKDIIYNGVLSARGEILIDSPIVKEQGILSAVGIKGMEVLTTSYNNLKTTDSNLKTSSFNVTNTFLTKNGMVEQFINVDNNQKTDIKLNVSSLVRIDYNVIEWNGTRHTLGKTPIRIDNHLEALGTESRQVETDLWFDDKYNKAIHFKDWLDKGGYILAYNNGSDNLIEFKFDNININTNFLVDPTFINMTNGFSTTASGSANGVDVWGNDTNIFIADITDSKVYSYLHDGTYVDVWNALSQLRGLCGNSTTLMQMQLNGDNVYYYDYDGNSGGNFPNGAAGNDNVNGLWCNDTGLLTVDYSDKRIYHITNPAGTLIKSYAVVTGNLLQGVTKFNDTNFIAVDQGLNLLWLDQNMTNISTYDFTNIAYSAEKYGVWGNGTDFWSSTGNGRILHFFNETVYPPVAEDVKIPINLTSPINYYNTSSQTITFNCSSQISNASRGLYNLSLIIDSNLNYTIYNTSGSTAFLSLEIARTGISEGYHNYSCASYSKNSTYFNISSNRTFTVDITPPLINLTNPRNQTYLDNSITVNRKQITINWTFSDLMPDTCKLYNSTGNMSVKCGDLNKTINITYGEKIFILWANDTVGFNSTSSISATYSYKLLENSQTYSAVAFEGSTSSFIANVTVGSSYSILSAELIYNNTIYAGTFSDVGANTILSKDIVIPGLTSSKNNSFKWQVYLSDGSIFNLTEYNQSTLPLTTDNCTALSKKVYNFTLYDEKDQTILTDNVKIETAFNVYSYDETTQVYNYSVSTNETSLLLCISNDTGLSNYTLNVIVKYSSTNHTTEYYNIVNASYTNSTATQTIHLYDLDNSQNTDFQLTFTGSDFLPIENALIYVNRQYIPENKFKTVELPKTDSNGQTIIHLVRSDVIYNIIVMKDGAVIGTFNNIVAFCEDYTIGNCKINLNSFETGEEVFNYDEDIGLLFSNINYVNSTKTVSFSFVTSDGNSKTVLMEVLKNDISGNKTLCNDTIISSSGTLSCVLPSNIEDSLIIVKIYVEGLQVLEDYIIIAYEGFGKSGNFLFFVYILAFMVLFGRSKNTFLIGIFLGFITSMLLGLFKGKIIGIASAGIWLAVIIIIALWKLNRNKES